MRKTVLFIAMSLDGYIAGSDGNVDWLAGQEADQDDMESYEEFIRDISTVIMGWNTYHQITTELSPENWMYSGLESYVVTHRNLPPTEEIRFTKEKVCDLVRRLRQEEGQGIWICGGADVVQQLVKEDLIDQYYISAIPTLLGGGIRLFGESNRELKLKLTGTKSYNGITDLIYERR
ncbi:MAG: dihydrofolate reductase [Clostridiales bacterium]|nr:dihydrofolate reductase [Clostridiales bacterium]